MVRALLYHTDGNVTEVYPKDGVSFSLKEMQDMVRGFIEIIRLSDTILMIVNENGKIDNLPTNEKATDYIRRYFPNCRDYIVGCALVCPDSLLK